MPNKGKTAYYFPSKGADVIPWSAIVSAHDSVDIVPTGAPPAGAY
jgi:hypothetical protein